MLEAKAGDQVKVHYTGKFNDGVTFDTSLKREPLEFSLGAGQMIKGFDEAVKGMKIGEEKTINLKPEEAYGEVNPEMMFNMPKQEIPEHMKIEVGMQLQAQTQSGQPIQVVVNEVRDQEVVLDANHPLAGKELVFEIKLLEINSGGEEKKPLLFD